jgi:predicted peptidase
MLALLMAVTMDAGRFEPRSVMVDRVSHRYQIWIPAGYHPSRKWPAILFLHGSGERGDDGDKQTSVGLGPALRNGKVGVRAIVVFPQCPEGERWARSAGKIAIAALDQTEHEFSIDPRRVSLTGMSMGGAGVWRLAADFPRRWSAIAPVCGYVHRPPSLPDAETPTTDSYTDFAQRLPRIPIWIFHGSSDPVVPVRESRSMADVLGANAAYTEFPGVGHNAWDPAYTATGLVSWLVRQKRSRS